MDPNADCDCGSGKKAGECCHVAEAPAAPAADAPAADAPAADAPAADAPAEGGEEEVKTDGM